MKRIAVALASVALLAGAVPANSVLAIDTPDAVTFRPLSGATAELVVQRDGRSDTVAITTLDEALALMADARLASVWPQITAWAGPDFERLQANTLRSARAVFATGRSKRADTPVASIVRTKLRPTFLLADALIDTGHGEEAAQLMRRARGVAPQRGSNGANEWAATSVWLSGTRFRLGDTPGALSMLDDSITLIADSRSRLNLEVNRIPYLLFANRPAEALVALNGVEAAFAAPGGDGPFTANARIRGTNRQFAWMRACALRKLGRADEAAPFVALLRSGEEPNEPRFVIEETVELRQTLALCSRDVAGAAQAYADGLAQEPVGGEALLVLQPAYRSPEVDREFLDQVRRHPTLAPVLATRMRVLPDALTPALTGWRDAQVGSAATPR